MDYTPEQMDTIFNELPDDVKEAMTSVDTVNILMNMKEKYALHIDQGGELSREIGLLMVGITPPQQFISKIEHSLRVPNDVAVKIATEVNERIFRPVRESLKQIHHMAPGARASGTVVPEKSTSSPSVPEKKDEMPISLPPDKPSDPYREPIN